MNKHILEFYGKNFTLLVLNLYRYNLKYFKNYLKKKIQEFPNILEKSPIVINIIYNIQLTDWLLIKDLVLFFKFKIIGFSGCKNNNLKDYIINSGIPYLNIKNKGFFHDLRKNSNKKYVNSCKDKYVKTITISYPIRSGQKIYSKNSDLVIINNVSHGAEIISNGNIHVYGILRGKAIAGSLGDLSSKIFCKICFPELIAIYSNYWLYDKIPKEIIGCSSYFFLKNNSLCAKKL
ncbi:septum site-determining protein MinC [Buchnera aphidicola (Chaitoregma tattakana)]|uniref:septum site-determining protein MinC n=1 Tax=Buchnera aphidicola TaxID=9 RepID=UPI0031B8607B